MNKVTVESLQKDLRSKYGVSVDIAKYSKQQLESYSSKIQNKLKEFEVKHKFNESLNNDEYQKTLLIGKIVESAINQYIDNPLESADEEDLGEDVMNVEADDVDVARDFAIEKDRELSDADKKVMQKLTGMIKQKQEEFKDARKGGYDEDVRMIASQLEDFYSIAELIRGKRPMGLDTSVMDLVHDMYDEVGAKFGESRSIGESIVKEGAEEQAELTMAAKDMVDRFTAFLEDVAEMGAEGMLELADSIRDELGQEQADQFVATVKPALEQTQEVLTTSREALTAGVGIITGETAPTDTIGAEPEGDIEEPADGAELPEVEPIEPADDEFGASDAAAGGTEPEGREKRESYQPKKQSVAESTRIMNKLAR